MKTLATLLLLLATPASAQTVWSNSTGLKTTSTCTADGETWEELGTTCHADSNVLSITNSIAGHLFSCPDGYELILRNGGAGRAACARDIIDAQ